MAGERSNSDKFVVAADTSTWMSNATTMQTNGPRVQSELVCLQALGYATLSLRKEGEPAIIEFAEVAKTCLSCRGELEHAMLQAAPVHGRSRESHQHDLWCCCGLSCVAST